MGTWQKCMAAAALAASVLAAPASAQDSSLFTLKQLYEICRSGNPQRKSACNGYVTGVRHTLTLLKRSMKDRLRLCIPATVNNAQFRDGFLAWAEKNQNYFSQFAASAVIKSAFERYPCAGKTDKPFEF